MICASKLIKNTFIAIFILTIIDLTYGTIEDIDREMVGTNFPYGRGVVIYLVIYFFKLIIIY